MVKLITKKMYVYDPHDAIFSLMEHQGEVPIITEGRAKDFKFKSIILLVILFIARAGAIDYIPKPVDYLVMLTAGFLTVEILIRYFKLLNKRIRFEGLGGIAKSIATIFLVIVLLAAFV